jgi:hypothetical protein
VLGVTTESARSQTSTPWTVTRVIDGDTVAHSSLTGAPWCFGCLRGARIYDLASLLASGAWGRDLRGEALRSARELVSAALE